MEPFCGENTPKNTRFGKKYVLKVRGEEAEEGEGYRRDRRNRCYKCYRSYRW